MRYFVVNYKTRDHEPAHDASGPCDCFYCMETAVQDGDPTFACLIAADDPSEVEARFYEDQDAEGWEMISFKEVAEDVPVIIKKVTDDAMWLTPM